MMATNLPRAAHGPSLRSAVRNDYTSRSDRAITARPNGIRLRANGEGTALAEVMFVNNDGRVQPFLYKLLPERNSWKIVNVQRMWFVPRSHLLRGVRA